MIKVLLLASIILLALERPDPVNAQFTDAHSYDNTPVGINELELSYSYVHANASIDASLIIAGANVNLNQGAVNCTRYFGVANHTMWVNAGVPIAGLNGKVAGTNIENAIAGAGDSSYQWGALLKGGPALSASQFENYKPVTIVGISLTMTAPTGLYHSNTILNLGAHRWSFRPELALSHPFGPEQKWQLDMYANIYFYTDNSSYHGRQYLRQEPLPGLEGHISYLFNDNVWASLDTRYSFHAPTVINGVDQHDAQENFILGGEMNVSINPRNSLLLEFAKVLVHHNGPNLVGLAVKYSYTWGKGYR